EKPAVIEEVEIRSDLPVKGEVSLVQVRPENAPPRRLTIAQATTSAELTVTQTLTNRVKVSLDYVEPRNLPSGPAGRSATIEAEFTVKGNDQGVFQAAALDAKAGLVRKNGDGDTEFEHAVNCNNRFKVSGSGRKLKIELTGFTGLASCQGKAIAKADPTKIGTRNVTLTDDGKPSTNHFKPEEEDQLGREAASELAAINPALIVPETHAIHGYVNDLMRRIADASDNRAMRPKVRVINADVLNAFALPGGYVFVFRGLIEKSRSEAELMGVLGHEWAHAVARHGTQNVTRAKITMRWYIVGLVASIAANVISDNQWVDFFAAFSREILLPVGAVGHILSGSRDFENEADKIGSQYAWANQYEPWGISDMFEVFKQQTGRRLSGLEEYFSSHPDLTKRQNRVLDLSGLYYPARAPYTHDSAAYARAKQAMATLPPAGSEQSFSYGNEFSAKANEYTQRYLQAYLDANKGKWATAALAGSLLLGGRGGGDKSAPPPAEEADEFECLKGFESYCDEAKARSAPAKR
ncbi:MAG TPA: M48 family metalloprotease, partial [Bdellovibrionota bacterium]|nr:M48 family metalloprotease [Bdellovibrionota bacterium]